MSIEFRETPQRASVGVQRLVPRFWLQETPSFEDGAPQREEYLTDRSFAAACLLYEEEWRGAYKCGDAECKNRDCPEHFPSRNAKDDGSKR